MPINDPVKGFHGERFEGDSHGGTCPLCGKGYDGFLSHHLPGCGNKPAFEWDRETGNGP